MPSTFASTNIAEMDYYIDRRQKKKEKKAYDGRTKEGRKFFERLLARREARQNAK